MKVFSFGYRWPSHPWPKGTRVFDARHIPDPSHDIRIRHLNGLHPEIQKRVYAIPGLMKWVDKICKNPQTEVIAIGCLGGVHRSVAIAEEFGRRLGVDPIHLDLPKREPWKNIPHKAASRSKENSNVQALKPQVRRRKGRVDEGVHQGQKNAVAAGARLVKKRR